VIIGELAERTGVNTWSLRHYDRAGLLTSVRGRNRYRDFPDTAVREVARIRCLLDAGFNLLAVKEVLPYISAEGRLEPSEAVLQVIDTHLLSLDAKITALERIRRVLRDTSDELRLRSSRPDTRPNPRRGPGPVHGKPTDAAG
jgi:DNA-binding transcriptional MerR regulator